MSFPIKSPKKIKKPIQKIPVTKENHIVKFVVIFIFSLFPETFASAIVGIIIIAIELLIADGNVITGKVIPARIPYKVRAELELRPYLTSINGISIASAL